MTEPSARILAAVSLLAPKAGERLLEIGCGTGHAAQAILALRPDCSIVALDRSATALGRTRANNCHAVETGRLVLLEGDVERDDVPPGPFDRAFAIRVNSFWTRPGVALARLLPAIGPGGKIWVIFDTSAAKSDGPTIASMREAGLEDVRSLSGDGAFALIGRKPG